MNLFATVLTHPAPTANYRGESELNRTVIQKLSDGRFDYPILSPEAMRNALREILRAYGLPQNRSRLEPVAGEGDEKQQLAVTFKDFPDPSQFADDFLFGYLLAVKGGDLKKVRDTRGKGFPLKRDSVLRMNLAKALEPYRHDAVFTQSPQFKGTPWKEDRADTSSALLHRETADTAFQYPFALNGDDCLFDYPDVQGRRAATPHPHGAAWTRALLRAIGELSNASGNHARSLFFMAPASVGVRVTDALAPGYEQYHFTVRRDPATDERIHGSRLITRLLAPDCPLPRGEFLVGGEIVETLAAEQRAALREAGVTLDADPRRLLMTAADRLLGAAPSGGA
jgi:CRISPR-associated protein Cst2